MVLNCSVVVAGVGRYITFREHTSGGVLPAKSNVSFFRILLVLAQSKSVVTASPKVHPKKVLRTTAHRTTIHRSQFHRTTIHRQARSWSGCRGVSKSLRSVNSIGSTKN